MLLGGAGGILARVALVDESNLDRFAGPFLDPFRNLKDLRAILLIGRRHAQGEHMSESIERQVDFIPLSAMCHHTRHERRFPAWITRSSCRRWPPSSAPRDRRRCARQPTDRIRWLQRLVP